jgi:hypothetical protein
MRRLYLSWFLPLLLVFAQHGAVLHELSHLHHGAYGAGAALQASAELLDSGPCLTCEAFAQVTSPAAAQAATLTACPASFIPTPEPYYTILSADAPTARSRGPPQI